LANEYELSFPEVEAGSLKPMRRVLNDLRNVSVEGSIAAQLENPGGDGDGSARGQEPGPPDGQGAEAEGECDDPEANAGTGGRRRVGAGGVEHVDWAATERGIAQSRWKTPRRAPTSRGVARVAFDDGVQAWAELSIARHALCRQNRG
jgi:hypothetical protein